MIQAPAESTDVIEAIVARLVADLHPRRVYLFGSRARGDASPDSDYDLMIEISGGAEEVRVVKEKLPHLFRETNYKVDLHLRSQGRIERRMDDPGTIDWDVVREGKLLFASAGLTALAVPPAKAVREPDSRRPDSVAEWLDIARQDLYHANHHLSDQLEDWSDEICFLSQQAAEKALKALIVSHRVRPVHSHDLVKLLLHSRSLGTQLDTLDDDCLLLSAYAVKPRYPGGSNLSRADAHAAVAAAKRIMSAVQAYLR